MKKWYEGNPCDYLESGRMDYFQLDYQFVGGFNNNALKVFWEIKDHKVKSNLGCC